MAYKIKPSLYVSFPVRHEIDGENVLESEPGWVELVENKAPAVRAEHLVVEIHLDLLSGGVDRELQVRIRISILSNTVTSINGLNAIMIVPIKIFPMKDLLPC